MNIQIKIVNPLLHSLGGLPDYHSPLSAGLDLRACIAEQITLQPNQTLLIGTGIAIFLNDPSSAAVILPRSGLGHKKGLILGNTVGLIDADYQGELFVSCWNRSQEEIVIEPGMRFAQLVILPIIKAQWEKVENFSENSTRSDGRFGSTGQK